MKTRNSIALIGLAGLLVTGYVLTQIYTDKKTRKELQEIAHELAYTWKKELGLTEEQMFLLEDIIIEYTIKKNEIINSALSDDRIITKLKAIREEEHRDLREFLSEEQFDAYIQTNKKMTRKA
ncbi:hypothetical protein ACW6QP_05105 [Salegentibacter sp. HM20]